MKGTFLTFEGVNYVGKTTHANHLAEYLKQKGQTVFVCTEANSTRMGKAVRKLAKDREIPRLDLTSCLLFETERAEFVQEVLRPRLANGEVVICERYCDSTLAYQGYGGGVDLDTIEKLNKIASQGVVPDLTFLIDAEIAQILVPREKLVGDLDYFESRPEAYLESVRQGFLRIKEKDPGRIRVIEYVPHNQQIMQMRIRGEIQKKFRW